MDCPVTGFIFFQKSFHRPIPYDWGRYTHLYLRLRGDGRTYALTVGIDNYYDVAWNDIFTFPLFTRGGPYWQVAKVSTIFTL